MKQKTFEATSGVELVVKHRRSAVILELGNRPHDRQYRHRFQFDSDTWKELTAYLEAAANDAWKNLVPKEADSEGADYYEYYDKEHDNNGYLSLHPNSLHLERPVLEDTRLYQFNKRKMESFLFDLQKQ